MLQPRCATSRLCCAASVRVSRLVAASVAPEFKLVDGQIERMHLIVTQLQQCARPAEFVGYVKAVDPPRALDDCLVLAAHQIASTGIRVERNHPPTLAPAINRQALQQVLVNQMVNAIHAMAQGGTLRLSTRHTHSDAVAIEVADTSSGQ